MKSITKIQELNLEEIPQDTISRYWYEINSKELKKTLLLPVFVAKGKEKGPVLGLTAVIHGNELNGLPVIQEIFRTINTKTLKGTVVGIPVLNIPGFREGKREFREVDLNRKMPGKTVGKWSDIYAHNFAKNILSQFHYLIDLHTASEGDSNSYYVRADTSYPSIKKLAELQNPDIILKHKGIQGMLRRAAFKMKIPAITVEIGNPSVYQKQLIQKSIQGIKNVMIHLKMQKGKIIKEGRVVRCTKSLEQYNTIPGILEVYPQLREKVKKGQIIARSKNIFGDVLKEYKAKATGIIIGRREAILNEAKTRIVHIGIINAQTHTKRPGKRRKTR